MVTLRTGEPQTGVIMGVHKPDGSLCWIRINSQPIRPVPGAAPQSVVATFTDITQERQLAQEVRRRAEQLALALQGANDGFWDWHVPSGATTFSERWTTMLGYQSGEIEETYAAWSGLVHPDDLAATQQCLGAHLRGETPFYSAEFRCRTKSGEWLWVQSRGQVVERDATGQAVRVAGTHTDVSDRRSADAQLREALRSNERLVEELRQALERVRTLAGLLPVCAWCKSVRNDQGYWQQIEEYLAEHTDAKLTHGLCPNCSQRLLE
jgi:PAS domain S-box-containing protein